MKSGPGRFAGIAICRDVIIWVIDKRYDHSMRIPRPDLSLELGTPNACTHCHDDKTDQWALALCE